MKVKRILFTILIALINVNLFSEQIALVSGVSTTWFKTNNEVRQFSTFDEGVEFGVNTKIPFNVKILYNGLLQIDDNQDLLYSVKINELTENFGIKSYFSIPLGIKIDTSDNTNFIIQPAIKTSFMRFKKDDFYNSEIFNLGLCLDFNFAYKFNKLISLFCTYSIDYNLLNYYTYQENKVYTYKAPKQGVEFDDKDEDTYTIQSYEYINKNNSCSFIGGGMFFCLGVEFNFLR